MGGLRRIGLNALYLVPGAVGGTEVYARRLVGALAAARRDWAWRVYCGRDAAEALRAESWPSSVTIVPSPRPSADKVSRFVLEQTWLPWRARRDRLDVLHSLGTTSPLARPVPGVVTVHDLIDREFPETFPIVARTVLRATVGPGARRSRRVLADSTASAGDIVKRLRVPPERVSVAPLGFNLVRVAARSPADVRRRLDLGDAAVLLCVSAALAHKNLERLVRAFAYIDRPDAILVLVGHYGRERDRLVAAAHAADVADRVRLTGWVPEDVLEGLYGLATGCVYPSLYEGFGLPVLEALGRGVPLACADRTSLPEVAGTAADLFDPCDEAAIAAAMRRLLDGGPEVERRRASGLARARQFTWDACAEATIAAYD